MFDKFALCCISFEELRSHFLGNIDIKNRFIWEENPAGEALGDEMRCVDVNSKIELSYVVVHIANA